MKQHIHQHLLRAAFVCACMLPASASASGRALVVKDPPRIVGWHLVGNIGLGMTATRVEYAYGYPTHRDTDSHGDWRTYRGRGDIRVGYDGKSRIVAVGTRSPAYRFTDGFGVGSTVPLGKCYRLKGTWEYRWRFFILGYAEGGGHAWYGTTRWAGNSVQVILWMDANRVSEIYMYVEKPHVCYPHYLTCDGVQ